MKWRGINLALKYTHGYGVVAVPVNEIDSRGNAVLWAHDIPIVAKKDLAVAHGEICYGELTNDRVYVKMNSTFRKARLTPRRSTTRPLPSARRRAARRHWRSAVLSARACGQALR